MKKYYKAVRGKRAMYSSVISAKGLRVTYREGEWVRPLLRGSLLFVFDDLSRAERHKTTSGSGSVWECEVIKPRRARWRCLVFDLSPIRRWWRERKKVGPSKVDNSISNFPGVVLVEAVKLIKKVV